LDAEIEAVKDRKAHGEAAHFEGGLDVGAHADEEKRVYGGDATATEVAR